MELYIVLVVLACIVVYVLSRKKKGGAPTIADEQGEETVTVEHKTEYDVIVVKDGQRFKGRCKGLAQGLQVFDDKGNCILDVTDRLCRLLGSRATGTQSGSFTVTGLSGNKLFAFLVGTHTPCDLTVSGGKVTWRYADFALAANMPPNGVIIYGSY